MSKLAKIYYVGQVRDFNNPTIWELQGIYLTLDDAVNAIRVVNNENLFVASITINTMLPLEAVKFEDFDDIAYYPLLEDVK